MTLTCRSSVPGSCLDAVDRVVSWVIIAAMR